MNKQYFNLDEEKCRIVLGAGRAALYRFDTGSVDPILTFDRSLFYESNQCFVASTTQTENQDLINRLNVQKLGHFSTEVPKRAGTTKPNFQNQFVWLELTSACNFRCVHCYASCAIEPQKDVTMETSHWETVIKQIRDMKIDRIQFVGGEPLMHPGFMNLLLFASGLNFKGIEVFTNGSLIDDTVLNALLAAGASLATTLYSHVPEVHDKVTGVSGSFARTLSSIKNAVDWGIPVRFGCVVNEVNLGHSSGLQEIASKIGVVYTGEDPARPVGRGKTAGCRTTINRPQIRPPFSTMKTQFESSHMFNPCWMGKTAVTETGDILPCVFARDWIAGNVLEKPFPEVIKTRMQTYWCLSKDKIKTCKDCEFRYACHDCRPMAAGYADGDMYAKTAACRYDPYSGKWN